VIPGGETRWHAHGIPINAHTTPTRRAWLAEQLEDLLTAANAFVAARLDGNAMETRGGE